MRAYAPPASVGAQRRSNDAPLTSPLAALAPRLSICILVFSNGRSIARLETIAEYVPLRGVTART